MSRQIVDEAWIWPALRAGEALALLAEAAGLAPRSVDLGVPGANLDSWVEEAARWLSVDVVRIDAPVGQIGAMIAGSVPALLRVEGGVIAVLAVRRRGSIVLTPEGGRRRVALACLVEALAGGALARAQVTPGAKSP